MKHAIIFQTVLLICQGVLYLGIQKFEGPAHDVSSKLDQKIPLWTPSVLVYVLWYPLIAIFPLCLYADAPEQYVWYIAAIIVDIFLSSIVYLVYPASFERPIPPDTVTGRILSILYVCNYKGKNCMPSMHCSMCFIIAFFAMLCIPGNVMLYAGFLLLALMIVVSTVLTKQHVIIDVITGLMVAVVAVGVGMWLKGLLP